MIELIAATIFMICKENPHFESETECHTAYVNCVIKTDAEAVKPQDYILCRDKLETKNARKPAIVWDEVRDVK